MSISYLRNVLEEIENLDSVSVQLLRITNNKSGTQYFARQIEIQPEEDLSSFMKNLSEKYLGLIESVDSVDDYCGDIVKGNIYKLSVDDEMIAEYFKSLEVVTANPSTEGDVVGRNWNAFFIKGKAKVLSEDKDVMLFSMKSPVSVLTNKYLLSGKDRFKRLNEPILTLNKNLDAVVVNGTLYMITMQAENLFNMERSYRKRCDEKVEEVIMLDILTNSDAFVNIATKGQNPRRFVSFNQSRLDAIKNTNSRKKYMKMFQISMKDSQIDTDDEKSSERLVKFLCDKAMLDPIDEKPREVSAAKAWL